MLTTDFSAMYAEKSVVYPGKERFINTRPLLALHTFRRRSSYCIRIKEWSRILKCKYYLDIHRKECALRKRRKFHVLKAFELRYCLLIQVVIVDVRTRMLFAWWSWYCSKQIRGTSQHAFIATYYRSAKKIECFYWFRINIFFRFNSATIDNCLTAKFCVMQTWMSICFQCQPIKFLYFQ